MPFDGETPVAVALKHIQDEPDAPSELKVDLPRAINNIIIKSIQKVPSARYQSAKAMLADLNQALNDPDGDFVVFNEPKQDESPTRRIKTINDVEKNASGDAGLTGNESEDVKKKKKRQQKIKLIVMIASILVIIICIGIVSWTRMSKKPEPIFLDNYVGKTIEQAKAELSKIGVTVSEKYINDEKKVKGIVLNQDVKPGREIKSGDSLELELSVSNGPDVITVPDLRNKDYRDATTELEGLKVKYTKLKYVREDEFDDLVTKDYVTRTIPEANEVIKPNTVITVFVSKGPFMPMTTVPNLINMNQQEAEQALEDNRLTKGSIIPEGNNFNSRVVTQNPLPNTQVEEGTPVDIILESVGNKNIDVSLPAKYNTFEGPYVNVRIDVIPKGNGTAETKLNVQVVKSEFPKVFSIPVPVGGTVKVYLDNNWLKDMQF